MEFFKESDCETFAYLDGTKKLCVPLEKANALIRERGILMGCRELKDSGLVYGHRGGWVAHEPKPWPPWPDGEDQTHRALLVCIEEIKAEEDSLESLVQKFSEHIKLYIQNLERAKKGEE